MGDDFHQNLDDSLKEFRAEVLKVELLEKWYKQRTYEIEKNTGLIDKALLFVNLALERGVKVFLLFLCRMKDTYKKIFSVSLFYLTSLLIQLYSQKILH